MRGSGAPDWATPGWMAASSPSKRKVRIGPPNPIGEGFADFDSYAGESCTSVSKLYDAQNARPGYGRCTALASALIGATGAIVYDMMSPCMCAAFGCQGLFS